MSCHNDVIILRIFEEVQTNNATINRTKLWHFLDAFSWISPNQQITYPKMNFAAEHKNRTMNFLNRKHILTIRYVVRLSYDSWFNYRPNWRNVTVKQNTKRVWNFYTSVAKKFLGKPWVSVIWIMWNHSYVKELVHWTMN